MPRHLLLAVLFCVACDRGSAWYGTTTPRHGPDEFWISNGLEPEWIDPGKCSDNPGGTIINNLFEGLVTPDPHTLTPLPGVASSWEVSADKRVWTFHLRPEAKWSDGVKVTADDFLYSWRRVLNPETDSKYADQFFDIENGEAFNRRALHVIADSEQAASKAVASFGPVKRVRPNRIGPGYFVFLEKEIDPTKASALPPGVSITDGSVLGLAAPDEATFVVTLSAPVSYFLPKITTLNTYYPVPRHVIERLEARHINPDLWTRVENIVSNGPFVLKDWKFRQELDFDQNPFYWNRAEVKLKHVRVLEIESYVTTLQMYKTGEIDWIGENADIPSEYAEYLRTKKDYRISPYLATYWYWFSVSDPAVKDPRIRHALDMAIDKKAIVEHVTRQAQPPAWSFVPEGLAGFHTLSTNTFDPEGGRKLLASAGITDPSALEITLTYNTSETHKAIAEAMQEMLRKNLGINAVIHNEEWGVFLRDLEGGKLQMGRLGWIGDYPDPYTFLATFLSESGNNHARWKNADFDRLMEESGLELDPQERLEKLEQAEKIADDELPALPIYFYTRHYLCKPYVKSLYNTFQDRHPWAAIWIDPDAAAKGTFEDGR